MKHVSILVPLGHASLSNIDGTQQILLEVNKFLMAMGRPPLFNVQLVGLVKETAQRDGMFIINPDHLIQDLVKTDMIIIPAIHSDLKKGLVDNAAFLPWIREQYIAGAEIVSLCVGAFLLAATGLLKGRQCATHWSTANEFRTMFPDVNLVDDKIMTEEDGIYTSGGAYAYLNLLLYLVEKNAGRDIAVLTAKAFMIDMDRISQSPFIIFQGQKSHTDEPVKKAQEFIENNFEEKITVDQIASMLAIGRRNLERRFKKATSNTVVEYIQRVKIEVAKKGLESSRENVNEVMYNVGYTDTKAFRTTFKKVTGLSPAQYRNKYSRALSV